MNEVNRQKGRRLREAREAAGYKTAADAARALRLPYPSYAGNENGSRGFNSTKAERFAKAFRCSLEWLLTGSGNREASGRMLAVRGYVGAGGEVIRLEADANAALDMVEAPPGTPADVIAVRVRGDSMYPAYQDGDTIFYQSEFMAAKDYIGRECVVLLADGRAMVKRLLPGSMPHLVTLHSYNAPPIADVEVQGASPVKWIARA